MQASLSQQPVQPPRPREAVGNDRSRDDVRLTDGDSWPVIQQPIPDWEWGPDDERRKR